MFYPLGKPPRKTLGGSLLRPYVRGLIHFPWSGMENLQAYFDNKKVTDDETIFRLLLPVVYMRRSEKQFCA